MIGSLTMSDGSHNFIYILYCVVVRYCIAYIYIYCIHHNDTCTIFIYKNNLKHAIANLPTQC